MASSETEPTTETTASPRDRTPKQVTVRKATKADLPAVTAVLARAFDTDPFANWAVAQDRYRARRIHDFMNVAAHRLTFPFGEVYAAEGYEGALLGNPPGKWKLGMLQQLMLAPAMARSTGWRRLPAVIKGLDGVEKKHPRAPHYYLLALGVSPDLQGKGIGSQLMQPILEKADREGMPAYLESSNIRNNPLYERHGFVVTEEHRLPDGPPIWLMWREPK